MQIAICDDEKIFRTGLKDHLIAYKNEKKIQIDIYEFENGNDFLNCGLIFDMVFLDYKMPDIDGLETARLLRLKNSLCSIVFVTSYADFFIRDAFEVNTYRFFDKPVSREKIYAMLDSYIVQQKNTSPITVCGVDGLKTISFKDIVFVEGDGKYSKIHTVSDTVRCSKTLGAVLELLPQYCFEKTHRSYAVNMYFISGIKDDSVLMINGEKAYLSRRYSSDFRKIYSEFIKNYYVRL